MKQGWEIKKLGEISEYFNGLTYSPRDVSDKGTIVLRSSNIQNNELDFSDLVRVNVNIKEKLFLKEGDIFYSNKSERYFDKSERYINYMVSFTNKLYEKYSQQAQIGVTKSTDIKSSEEDSHNKTFSTTDEIGRASCRERV